jgi:hypothetical protein
MYDSSRCLSALLAQWKERHDRNGEDPPARELCRDCPELVPELEKAIRRARREAALARPDPCSLVPCSSEGPVSFMGEEPIPGSRRVRLLGRGSFGEVWEVHSPAYPKPVAIKFVRGPFSRCSFQVELSSTSAHFQGSSSGARACSSRARNGWESFRKAGA